MTTKASTEEHNKVFIHRYLSAISGQPKTEAQMREFTTDESLIGHVNEAEAAFPGYELLIDDTVAEGDKVVVRTRLRGVHRGEFAGIAPTGRTVEAPVIIIYQIAQDKIIKFWLQADMLGLLRQLDGA